MSWADPFVIIPAGLLALLVLARLARLRPGLRPLVGPFALLRPRCSAASPCSPADRCPPRRGWRSSFLLPLLTLVVRGNVIAFQWLFQRRHGVGARRRCSTASSPSRFYGVGLGAVAHYWFELELTPFLATSAVVGAVVGLALQDTLGNLFAGIALHTEAPFRVGDWVRVADRDGRIEQVSWRAMRLRTWDGDTLTIPNNEVSRHAMLNYSVPAAPHSRLILVHIGYETPPNRAIGVLRGALAQVDGMAAGVSPNIRIVGYHDFAIRYEIRYFFGSYEDYRVIEGEIYRLVWYHLRRAGIEFALPISNVVVQQNLAAPRAEDAGRPRCCPRCAASTCSDRLSDAELHTVASRLRPQHYAAGEKIIEEGAAGDSLFLVDRGEVRVLRRLGGTPREIARLGEGECFGEMAMLTGQQRTATVVAGTDVDVFMIDKTGFQDILAGNPDMAVDISALLAKRRAALPRRRGGRHHQDPRRRAGPRTAISARRSSTASAATSACERRRRRHALRGADGGRRGCAARARGAGGGAARPHRARRRPAPGGPPAVPRGPGHHAAVVGGPAPAGVGGAEPPRVARAGPAPGRLALLARPRRRRRVAPGGRGGAGARGGAAPRPHGATCGWATASRWRRSPPRRCWPGCSRTAIRGWSRRA